MAKIERSIYLAILTKEEMLGRLAHDKNFVRGRGRTKGAKNLPDKIRELAGFNSYFDKAKNVGSSFGIAPITAHMAKRSEGHPEVKEKIDKRLNDVRDKGLELLTSLLNGTTPEELLKLKTLNKLRAGDKLAAIVDKATPKVIQSNEGSKILIYAPVVRSEDDYETIEINGTNS